MEEKYPCPKMTPTKWIVNFWYYNKWFVLVGAVFLVLIVIATVQFFKKSEPDVSIMYAGPSIVSDEDCQKMIKFSRDLFADVNGDGKVSVNMKTFVLNAKSGVLDSDKVSFKNGYSVQILEGQVEGRKIQANEEFQAYSDEILYGECCVLILDENLYQELSSRGALVPLKDIFSSKLPENVVGEYGIRLIDTVFARKEGFSSLPFESVLCLKYPSAAEGQTKEDREREYRNNLENFRKLVD